jgi:hypothetical protein
MTTPSSQRSIDGCGNARPGATESALGPVMTAVGVVLQTVWSVLLLMSEQSVNAVALLFYGVPFFVVYWLVRFWVHAGSRSRPRSKRWMLAPALLALPIVLVFLDVPFQARWLMSRSAFDRFVRAEGSVARPMDSAPIRVGAFSVREVEVRPDGVIRIVTKWDWGRCGLVFSPNGQPPGGSDDHYKHLDGAWWSWFESF